MKFYYIYNPKMDIQRIAEIFQIAPDFAASVSNYFCSFSHISHHPLAWSRFASDQYFMGPILGYFEKDSLANFLSDFSSLAKQMGISQDSTRVYKHPDGEIELSFSIEERFHWNYVGENLETFSRIFAERPFFDFRLGSLETDEHFMNADADFLWPSTDRIGGLDGLADDFNYELGKGLLGELGYRVGERGESDEIRREILRKVFTLDQSLFPDQFKGDCRLNWGLAGSSQRLQKIAGLLVFFLRAFVAKHGRERSAVKEWESDLQWLKTNFYKDGFSFRWPDSRDWS